MAASGAGILASMDDFTMDASMRMNAVLHKSLLSANIQPNLSKGFGRHFIILQDNKQTSQKQPQLYRVKR